MKSTAKHQKISVLISILIGLSIFTSTISYSSSLTVEDLPASQNEDNPVCYDQNTGAIGNCDPAIFGRKARTVWVAKDGTGDFTSPVVAMNASDQWCPSPTDSNRCLLKIAPGKYDLQFFSLMMKDYIDIEGSGVDTTLIYGVRDYGFTSGLVKGAKSAIRSLSLFAVASTAGAVSTAIYNDSLFLKIDDVSVRASGSHVAQYAYGINNRGGTIEIKQSKIEAVDAELVRALYNRDGTVSVNYSDLYTDIDTCLTSCYAILTKNSIEPSSDLTTVKFSEMYGDINAGADTVVRIFNSYIDANEIVGAGEKNCRAVTTFFNFYSNTCL